MAKSEFQQVSPRKIAVEDGFNPRTDFDTGLEDLTNDIAVRGILQPLIVRAAQEEGHYVLVDGERRLRAIGTLLEKGHRIQRIPVRVLDVEDSEALAMALSTGTGALPLGFLEESEAVGRFYKLWGWKQREISDKLGRSQSWVSERVAVFGAIDSARESYRKGKLTKAALVEISRENKTAQETALEDALASRKPGANGAPKKAKPKAARRPGPQQIRNFVQMYILGVEAEWSAQEITTILQWITGDKTEKQAIKAVGTEMTPLKPAPSKAPARPSKPA